MEDYLEQTGMLNERVLALLLQTVIYSLKAGEFWLAVFPCSVDRTIPKDVSGKSMYICYTENHFEVVTAVWRR